VGILKPQIGIIDIAAELRGLRPNLSNKNPNHRKRWGIFNVMIPQCLQRLGFPLLVSRIERGIITNQK